MARNDVALTVALVDRRGDPTHVLGDDRPDPDPPTFFERSRRASAMTAVQV